MMETKNDGVEKFSLVKPYWHKYIIIFTLFILTAGFQSVVPYSFSIIIDRALIGPDRWLLKYILWGLAGGAVVVGIIGVYRDYLYSTLAADILARVRLQVFKHLQRLSMDFYSKTEPGNILSRFSSDLTMIEDVMVNATWYFFIPCLHVIFNIVFIFVLDWRLGLISLVIFPICFIGPRIFAPKATDAGYERKKCEADALTRVSENISAQTVIKALNLQNDSISKFDNKNQALKKNMVRAFFFGSLVDQSGVVGVMALQVSVLAIGAFMVANGALEVGKLVAIQTLVMTMCESVSATIEFLPICMQAFVGVRRIKEILNEKPKVLNAPDAGTLNPLKGEIKFNDVIFGYTKQQINLSNVNLVLKKGQSAAFVGPSGSGKSTIMALLMRFYDPNSGTVTFDDTDIKTVTQESLRDQLGIVLQENILFNISIRDNLRLAKPSASDAEIEEAAKKAEIHDFILTMPEGYDTLAGERGSRLSGGQRQRMAIARALLRSGGILMFDEATSALDPSSESSINQTIDKICKSGFTVISVTHRLASVVNLDRIFVMDQGVLVENGKHSELLDGNGIYKMLWEKQGGFKQAEDGTSFSISTERLLKIPFFKPLAENQALLEKMAGAFVSEQYSTDHIVLRQGDYSHRFFVIVRGTAEITITDENDIVQQYDVLSDGDIFGELALSKDCNVLTLVRTLTPCVFLTLRREDFNEILEKTPQIRTEIENIILAAEKHEEAESA